MNKTRSLPSNEPLVIPFEILADKKVSNMREENRGAWDGSSG